MSRKKKNEKQKKRKQKQEVEKTILDVFPIRSYDRELGSYVLSEGSLMDLIEIQSKDIRNSMTDDVKFDCFKFAKFLKLEDENKLISMNFPTNTSRSRKSLEKKLNSTNDPIRKKWLKRSITEMEKLDRHTDRREYYMMYFGETLDELEKHRNTIYSVLEPTRNGMVRVMSEEKKHQVLFKLNNMSSLILPGESEEPEPAGDYHGQGTKWKKPDGEEIDWNLIERIQPQGGITFKEPGHIVTGSGYVKVLHVYELPNGLDDFWMMKLCNIEGAVTTVDIATKDTAEAKSSINKSIQEQQSRESSAKTFGEQYNARERQRELANMLRELETMGEVVKMLHFRIFLSDRILVNLEERAARIMTNLEADQFMTTPMLNEGGREWKSMFQPYSVQHKLPFHIKSHPLMSEQVAGGNPFHFSELQDEYGTFLGYTPCGNVIFDEFAKTQARKYYNSVVIGDMGSGKSTLLKKRLRVMYEKGNFARIFDVTGEFQDVTHEFGGKVIRCNGEDGMLNPLEILQAAEDEDTNFSRHISKLMTFYRCHVPNADDSEMIDLQNVLRAFYQDWGLVPEKGKRITKLPSKSYPIFSDLLAFLERRIQETLAKRTEGMEQVLVKEELMGLAKIKKMIESLVHNYGHIFDGHTSIDNIIDRRIVTFDISMLKDMDSAVFDSVLFNMVSLCWDNCVANGTIMKEKYETGRLVDEEITKFLILIDESHRWINTKKPQLLDLITVYLREARKFFGGIMLASQSIRDFVPEGLDGSNMDKLKTVFELTQYKFIFHQDSTVLPYLDAIFNNVLTSSQRADIPMLGTGDTILSISGDRNLKLHVYLHPTYEKPLYRGGK